MAAFIFDASGIVKRYVTEIGTAWVKTLTDPLAGHEIFLTRITRVEVTAAITRRGKRGFPSGATGAAILTAFRYNAAHQYNIIEINSALLSEAERLAEVHELRGYDAVQLAATMNLHQARAAAGLSVLTFISADGDLNTAAIAEGLAVENPNIHQLSIQSHMPDPPPLHVFSVIGGGIMDVPSNAPDPPEKGEHSVFARHALRGGVTFGERSRRNLAECFRLRVVL